MINLDDRNVRSGREAPLLERTVVDGETNQFGTDAAKIADCRNTSRRAVPGNNDTRPLVGLERSAERRRLGNDLGFELLELRQREPPLFFADQLRYPT